MLALMMTLAMALAADVDGANHDDDYRWLSTADEPTRLYLYREACSRAATIWSALLSPVRRHGVGRAVRAAAAASLFRRGPRQSARGAALSAQRRTGRSRGGARRRREGNRRRPEQAARHRHRAGRRAQEGPGGDRVASVVRSAARFDVDPRLSAGPLVARRRLRRRAGSRPSTIKLARREKCCIARKTTSAARRRGGNGTVAAAKETYDPRMEPDLRTWLRSILPLADLVRGLSVLAAAGLGFVFARLVAR